MKKLLTSASLIACLVAFGSTSSKAQAVEQGTVIFDVTYGFPNLYGSLIEAHYVDLSYTATNSKVSNIGAVGFKGEYMISDRFGLGLAFAYANSTLTFQDSSYDSGTLKSTNYDYKVSVPRLSAIAKGNIHLGSSDVWDPYVTFGLGYRSVTIKEETKDPNFTYGTFDIPKLPVGYRAGFGVRYFFTDNLGANVEAGLGGAVLTFGLSTKF